MLRRMSKSFEESHPPEGFAAAAGALASSALDSSTSQHSNHVVQDARENITEKSSSTSPEARDEEEHASNTARPRRCSRATSDTVDPNECDAFENGYHFPAGHRWQESLKLGSIAFAKFAITPLGFCITVYGLLIVAWGGMLFLLLVNAAPAMCSPTCNDINSPRRIWVEIDSQILNALFCVTGFGLAPWRFRDLYYLLQYRLLGNTMGLRRLAGIHRGWFRLDGSQLLPVDIGPDNVDKFDPPRSHVAVPYPVKTIPDTPLTGIRAPPTRLWKMDFVVWTFVLNTCFQCVLAGYMWGMNRYDRPSWATGLWVCLGMLTGAVAGWVQFREGRAIKSFEGVPVSSEELGRLRQDQELGVLHYNNIKDKKPKDKEDKLSMYHRHNFGQDSKR
jgi:hypothetical protein